MKLKDIVGINLKTINKKYDGQIQYLDTSSVTDNHFKGYRTYGNIQSAPSRARRIANIGDTVISTVRPNQKHNGFIDTQPDNAIYSTGFTIVSPNTDRVNPYYLYLFLSSEKVTEFLQQIGETSTSAYPSVKPSDIENLDIDLPSRDVQDKISKEIYLLDSKIKLNNKINDNLSKFRELLYMRLIQSSDVKEVKLTELFNIAYGKNIAKSELTRSGTKVFGANGLIGYTQKPSIISAPTVTITSRGSGSGYVSYLNIGNAFLTNNLLYLNENKNLGLSFSYETIKSANPKQFVTGSAQPQLTIKNLSQSLVKIPSDINLVNKFRRQMYPIEEIIKHNSFENEKLEMLKNTLLNKCF